MPEEMPHRETDDEAGGAPGWMLTYGDSVTLLLTFFVLLLTFSTPNPEDFATLAQGLMPDSRRAPMFQTEPGADGLTREQRRLEQARLDTEGAEKPPLYAEHPTEELTRYPEELEIAELQHLKGAIVIRVPLTELFGTDEELDPAGRDILQYVLRLSRAHPYSIVVRARAGRAVPEDVRQVRSVIYALGIVTYLRTHGGDGTEDIGLSDNIELAPEPLPEGMCEIILLEV